MYVGKLEAAAEDITIDFTYFIEVMEVISSYLIVMAQQVTIPCKYAPIAAAEEA
jgi:hypothetical protein